MSEAKFYKRLIEIADKRFKEHLDTCKAVMVMMMRGMISVDQVLASLPRKRRAAIEKRGKELLARVARQMTLKEIRKERSVTQAEVAEALGIGQMQISRLEKRRDPRLSTMQKTVAALGGELTLVAIFPDQDPVVIVAAAEGRKKAS